MRALLPLVVSFAVALAGCQAPPPAEPAPPADGPDASTVAAVAIEEPVRLPDGEVRVCWAVSGAGSIAHTAIHWDDEAHTEDARTFAAYALGVRWPGNSEGPDPAGYAIPGRFCATLPPPSEGALHVVAHAIDDGGPPGVLSAEAVVEAEERDEAPEEGPGSTDIRIVAAPADAPAGGRAEVCFEVEGQGSAAQVSLRWDDEPHGAEGAAHPATAYASVAYPGDSDRPAPGGYPLPGRFCANVTMPDEGSVFVVAFVLDHAGAPARVTTEREIAVQRAARSEVAIRGFAFSPRTLVVAPGSDVVVTNEDGAPHTLTADDGAFDTGTLGRGGSATIRAPETPGSYSFRCSIHASMRGVLDVA